jgi:hypothetical protein
VDVLNQRLCSVVADIHRVDYAWSRGRSSPPADLFLDGTHFNDRGNKKLYRGIRGAIVPLCGRVLFPSHFVFVRYLSKIFIFI